MINSIPNLLFLILTVTLVCTGCDPMMDDDIDLGPLPDDPAFSMNMVPGDSNRIVVTDLSDFGFDRLWVFEGGDPATSKLETDTVFYSKAGTYNVTLHISSETGNGTASASQTITIVKDVQAECDEKISLLTGECGAGGKCWVFSQEAGAVTVGPTYGSSEWFTSTAGGLQPEQYDDRWCFLFEDRAFDYRNNGATVDPWQGYEPVPFDPPAAQWTFREGTGMNGADQIVLSDELFMGVWDSDNILDIVILTEDELVVRAPFRDPDGVPLAEGWFELHFVKE